MHRLHAAILEQDGAVGGERCWHTVILHDVRVVAVVSTQIEQSTSDGVDLTFGRVATTLDVIWLYSLHVERKYCDFST
jgi:hypothetical protein